MVVKVKEYFERTSYDKNIDKSKKYILREQRNTRYHEKRLSNKKKSHNFTNFLEDYNRYRVENFNVHLIFNGLSKNRSHVVVV